jgi:zinc and cadmium transporter
MLLLAWILASTLLVGGISLIGIFFLSMSENLFRKLLLVLVSFASGTLLGGAFLHLIPEALSAGSENMFIFILVGILVFFLLEKFLWRHCHERECPVHVFAYLSLIGDGVHNFIDGVIIAASFFAGVPLGLATTLAVTVHEVPQEIGDFSILVYGGFGKVKALFYNLLSALMAVFGALLMYFSSSFLPDLAYFLVFAAGGFIYIATADLIPEMHKEKDAWKSLAQFVFLLVGMALMWLLRE